MKRILVNGYMQENLGDDLFFKILFDRYKDVIWTMNTYDKEYNKIYKKYRFVKIKNRIIKKFKLENESYYKKFDAIIYIGGSIFIENSNWENQYIERKALIKKFEGKKIFFIGSNFGPFYTEEYYRKYKDMFNKCTDICFRDNYSFNLFNKEVSNCRVAPDIVFQLKNRKKEKKKKTLGISLINLKSREKLCLYHDKYINKIIEIVYRFLKEDYDIYFFAFCKKEKDMSVINEIIDKIEEKKDKIRIIEYDGDLDKFLSYFSSMELIIGTRFHACILSQVFGQGLYPIIYSEKTYNVLKDINLDSHYTYIQDIENLHVEDVIGSIKDNKIHDRSIFKDAEKQFEVLDKFILG